MSLPDAAPRAFLSLLAALLVACGGGGGDTRASRGSAAQPSGDATRGERRDASGAASAQPRPIGGAGSGIPAPGDSAAIAASADAPCAMFGLWQPCSVIRRLESAGLGPVPLEGAVRQPGISIDGSAFRLGRGELQVYLYADSASAIGEAGRVEPRRTEPARTRGIRRPPTVIRSGNLVALLFNNNDRQLERVQLALTAGLPGA